MRKVINLCFVLLAIAAVIYGLVVRYSNYKTTKESHTMELVKEEPESHNLISNSGNNKTTPY